MLSVLRVPVFMLMSGSDWLLRGACRPPACLPSLACPAGASFPGNLGLGAATVTATLARAGSGVSGEKGLVDAVVVLVLFLRVFHLLPAT